MKLQNYERLVTISFILFFILFTMILTVFGIVYFFQETTLWALLVSGMGIGLFFPLVLVLISVIKEDDD